MVKPIQLRANCSLFDANWRQFDAKSSRIAAKAVPLTAELRHGPGQRGPSAAAGVFTMSISV